MALAWSDRGLSATALSETGQWACCLGSGEQQLGSSTWSCAQGQGFREVPSELIHQPWASLTVSSTCTGQESVYCVDGNGYKGGVCYVVDVLVCSWETVLRSWCICFTWVLGTSMPVLMSEWQVLYQLSRRSTSLPVFVIIGLDYYFPWVPKFYLIHIHCDILDKYKRMWASRRKTPLILFYVCIQKHMSHFCFLVCCCPSLRSCLTDCFLNLLKLKLHHMF